jgi:transposase
MLKAAPLSLDEKTTLDQGFRNHPKFHMRRKFHIALLYTEGRSPKDIAELYKVKKRSVYEWIHAFEKEGFLSFYIKNGRGRKATMVDITPEQKETIRLAVDKNPQSLRSVAAKLSRELGISITKPKLKVYIKAKLKYSYHRIRKWLKPKRNEIDYEKLKAELGIMLKMESEGNIRLYFADQSGFSLEPCIPYGWQPVGEHVGIVPQKSKRRNIFGLLRRNNEFHCYEVTGTMNTDFVITSLDDFADKLTERSIVCLDNASIHRSKKFKQKLKEWQLKDLWIWHFPTYSPHLNIIETLWRKIKYEWLKPHDYLNLTTFNAALDSILEKIGIEFNIKFT